MSKLFCCCTDPTCPTLHNMIVKLRVWGIDTTPKKDGRGLYFDAEMEDAWRPLRREAFAQLVRQWPKGH